MGLRYLLFLCLVVLQLLTEDSAAIVQEEGNIIHTKYVFNLN